MSTAPDPEKGPGATDGWTSSSSVQSENPAHEKQDQPTHTSKSRMGESPFDNYDPSHDATREELEPDDDDDDDIGPANAQDAASIAGPSIFKTQTSGSTASRPPDFEVTFGPDDPENPKNWPMWYQVWVLVVISLSCWIVVLYSTSYTASIPGLMKEFNASKTYATLGMTTYLLGLATGCLVVAPLSELYGRQRVYVVCMICSTLMIIPSGLANSLEQQFASRFVGALFGAALISNSPGTVVDIASEEYRALYMSLWSIAPLNGPVTGPIIGGFVFQSLGWRWCNWIVLILASCAIAAMLTLKETYAPTILKRKAARLREETDDPRWWCRYDSKLSMVEILKTNLSRPFILAATEPILWAANLWISVIYGILYLCFIAYPIVFSEYRGWGPGISGLSFTGIGIGTLLAIFCEPLLRRIVNAHPRDPETGKVLPEAAARIMTIGAVLTPLGQLVFAWTSLPASIHWAVPIIFGIPFGAGNTLSFIYGANYLGGVYGIYAASALAGNAVIRSVFGGVLPLAGPVMYKALSPQWAGTLLGLLEVALIPVPLAFWKYGKRIRSKSRIIRQMREDQEKNESRRARALAKAEERKAREARESRFRSEPAETMTKSEEVIDAGGK